MIVNKKIQVRTRRPDWSLDQ